MPACPGDKGLGSGKQCGGTGVAGRGGREADACTQQGCPRPRCAMRAVSVQGTEEGPGLVVVLGEPWRGPSTSKPEAPPSRGGHQLPEAPSALAVGAGRRALWASLLPRHPAGWAPTGMGRTCSGGHRKSTRGMWGSQAGVGA